MKQTKIWVFIIASSPTPTTTHVLAADPSLSVQLNPTHFLWRPLQHPGAPFLQLFSLFLKGSYVWSSQHLQALRPHLQPLPPQTNAAGVQFVVTAGRPVRTAGLHQDNSGLYAFMKLSNTHTLKSPPILLLLSCFKGWLLVSASDFISSALWCVWLSTCEDFWSIKKSLLPLLLRFFFLVIMTCLFVHL